ncbi:MAG: DUF5916 domain-containing protein [Acidobacteriota bacterium]|nr:DUF5916 domain-containing protein [Acidobacteriota bacterium]
MRRAPFFIAAAIILTSVLVAADTDRKIYTTRHVNPHPPVIDGIPNDPAWEKVEWQTDFIQWKPYEGKPPSQRTAFKILYDDKNLYIAIRAFDTEPGKIERRISRRDILDGDWVSVAFDSYFDRRTAFNFTVNAAGVKVDSLMSNDGQSEDHSWDPIWEVRTAMDAEGWTAEMRIPFSQLRFGTKEEQIWGLQVARNVFRNDERSLWQFIPRNASGWVNGFGELHGLKGLRPPRQVELFPYAVGKHQTYRKVDGNPFATGRDSSFYGGLDGKIGVTSDLTLNFTVYPDFGQVEADPSVVNLTAFETYYQEKRPFFVEGRNILSFQLMGGDGDFSSDNLFYTRRVGRAPQFYPQAGPGGYVEMPEAASILGAFKLTGKTRRGLSIGIIESVTSQERATIFRSGNLFEQTVEPLTNYLGLRLQQDFREGKSSVGFMATAVNRDIRNENLSFLHDQAYTGGIDAYHSWKNRAYALSFNSVFSWVHGTPEALLRTQTSPLRYFQRPDASHVELDPNRTSLAGHGGTFVIQKMGGGRIQASTGVTWRSPGLELNDMGFLRGADSIMQFFWLGYRITEPFFFFRSFNISVNQWRGWNFSGENIFDGGNVNFGGQFKNHWSAWLGINRNFESLQASALRGGPALRVPGANNLWASIQTDMRRKVRLTFNGSSFRRDNGETRSFSLQGGVIFNPTKALNLWLLPTYSENFNELQYIATRNSAGEPRAIFGRIEQKTLAMTVRLNYSLTPDLSIQFYGQPFASSGKYTRFKQITDSRSRDYDARYRLFDENELLYDEAARLFRVDESGDGMPDYSFGRPDFSFLQLRSNLVVRWEYRPGSALYLVWSQGRTGALQETDFSFGRDMGNLFGLHPHNVFLVKFSYAFQL